MITFKAHGIEFQTNDNWNGLWVQNQYGEFVQRYGTAQAAGKAQVQRIARQIAKEKKEFETEKRDLGLDW